MHVLRKQPTIVQHALALSVALAAAFAVAAGPATAAQPAEAVHAALLTTDAAVESGRFFATMNERGFVKTKRVISQNRLDYSFNLGDSSRLSQDLAMTLPAAKFNFRMVALKRKLYLRGGGVNYWIPVKASQWRKQFRSQHAEDLPALVTSTLAALGDWRDDGPGLSDGVAIQNYSAIVDFSTLANETLPNLTKIVHDGQFNLFISDPKKWRDASPVGAAVPRVTFGIDADNVLRRVHVEAPSPFVAQGYELVGDFELTQINKRVPVKPLPNARRVTQKNFLKFFSAVFGVNP